MPGTDQEYLDYAVSDAIMPIRWLDGSFVTPRDRENLAAIRAYSRRFADRQRSAAQRKAVRLLKSFLSREQKRQLSSTRGFLVIATSGHEYRLWPETGNVERVTLHGKRRFKALQFCLHDEPDCDGKRMPPADLSLAHMLWILTDEAGFLATANATNCRDQLWSGEYQRRLREARVARAGAPAVEGP